MKRFLTAVVVMFLAMNTSAASKQILINEIVVEANSNVPDEVIQSETTLVAGKWYTEDQIRNGVARVRRMPLIYDATYSIEGSRLTIVVTESSWFSYDVQGQGISFANQGGGVAAIANVGAQRFFGRHVLATASFGSQGAEGFSAGAAAAALQFYDLFGTRLRARLELQQSIDDGRDSDIAPVVSLALPLTPTQSITASGARFYESFDTSFFSIPEHAQGFRERRTAELFWRFETTDDPFFTRDGWSVFAGPTWAKDDQDFPFVQGRPAVIVSNRSEFTETALTAYGTRWTPFLTRAYAFGRVGFTAAHSDRESERFAGFETDRRSTEVAVGLGRDFGDSGQLAVESRNRLELTVAAVSNQFNTDGSSTIINTTGGWVHRSRFGTVRVSLIYTTD